MARSKLKNALDRHKGVDHALEHQKKLQKAADKRKRSKKEAESVGEEEDDEAMDGFVDGENDADEAAMVFDETGNLAEGGDEDDQWTDEDSEGDDDQDINVRHDLNSVSSIEWVLSNADMRSQTNLARLQNSDSDSESENEDDDHDTQVNTTTKPQQARPNGTLAESKTPANALNGATKAIHPSNSPDDEDIPLSDLSDADFGDEDIIPHQRLSINNKAALQRALMSIALPTSQLPFSEHMSVTSSNSTVIKDIEDEFEREPALYEQALHAVREAKTQLKKEGVPFSRPHDYFAEMVKTDEHMGKIKAKLVEQAAGEKASKEARRQRDLKKFGKAVQVEKLKERAKSKKDMLEKVNSLKRKRQGAGLDTTNEEDMFDVALEDAATSEKKDRETRRAKGSRGEPGRKRQKKDDKFGYGGKKKYAKSNDATSSGDMRGFSARRMKTPGKPSGKPSGKSKVGASKRVGKSRRAKQK
ncbi:MAG: rRNA-processing protein and EBNA1-binding protein ebp2 [Chrysothrix sp. TS-e1954]|nr:MAG: rRNA-processing protein and EBNA1-binding protein ebp2 [Chrysothrix sp. TS-e1954]